MSVAPGLTNNEGAFSPECIVCPRRKYILGLIPNLIRSIVTLSNEAAKPVGNSEAGDLEIRTARAC